MREWGGGGRVGGVAEACACREGAGASARRPRCGVWEDRYPINYLQPVDIAVLFEAMGFTKCIPTILAAPVDGPTLAMLGADDFIQARRISPPLEALQRLFFFNRLCADWPHPFPAPVRYLCSIVA